MKLLGMPWQPILWLCALCLLAPFIYAFAFCYPRGDDFDGFTRAMFLFDLPGALYEVGREWLTWSGRYTYHFLAVFLGKAADSVAASGLVCASVLFVYWLAAYALARTWTLASRSSAALWAVLATATLCACHGCLPNFYLLTDALTSGLQGACFLLFFACACHLWQTCETARKNGNIEPHSYRKRTRRAYHLTILTGIAAIGVYEHSALAVFWLALALSGLEILWQKRSGIPPGRSGALQSTLSPLYADRFRKLFIWLCPALCFSFLAPGNFNRNMVRGIGSDRQFDQLGSVAPDWLAAINQFFFSAWPLAIISFALFSRLVFRNGKNHGDGAVCLCVICAAIPLTFSITLLHAFSDVPLLSTPKLSASLHLYLAIALGLLVWFMPMPHAAANVRSICAMLAVTVLLVCLGYAPNTQKTFIAAANGQMIGLARFMDCRRHYLRDISASWQSDPFGLYGEITKPGIRKRQPDMNGPVAVVQAISEPVFPVYMNDALAGNFTQWPNLWAAWMWNCGAIRNAPPEGQGALAQVLGGEAMELTVPQELGAYGVQMAWRAVAQGGPNATFDNEWLVFMLAGESRDAWILHISPPDWRRLCPVLLQDAGLQKFANSYRLEDRDFWLALDAIPRHFKKGAQICLSGLLSETDHAPGAPYNKKTKMIARKSHFLLLPLGRVAGWSAIQPQYVFASFDGNVYYRLDPLIN